MQKIVIDPMTRIEGHMKVEVTLDNTGTVVEARSSGLLYRGVELILRGRDPRDAARITQRVCGVCPVPHGTASALCLDSAFGISNKIPKNGVILRNIILASEYVHNHILHFYHLCSLDYADIVRAVSYTENDFEPLRQFASRGELAPFMPRYEGDYRLNDDDNKALVLHYIQALEMRRKAHDMLALFGGRTPIQAGIVAGGVTSQPTTDKVLSFYWRARELYDFIANAYLPDVLRVAKAYSDYFGIGAGCGNFITFGFFDLDGDEPDYAKRKRLLKQGTTDRSLKYEALDLSQISEVVRHSWYDDDGTPNPKKESAYSFIKAPRYNGITHEVGPLARLLVNYASGNEEIRKELEILMGELSIGVDSMLSVMGRHIARAIEAKVIAKALCDWVLKLNPDEPTFVPYELPSHAEGIGAIDAPRGCLMHSVRIENGVIANYSIISPTTWNGSPMDDNGQRGPIEEALVGTKVSDPENPKEIARIVRSFDPCIACAVHVTNLRGMLIREVRIFA
ncbi:MAG: nickel-dependent hydrogenase large subunit [Armatimonadota bacterium]|nr:nickel-dependent hydrogenase large subunit [Armatimonadota bacterium]MCX7778403.1 nickel-dependent hydrogenase large subunit [Armatimonadota bacterium]MDW8026243.1 nickel-dependent hydrogenase large subunit [Armatimonadota bacterium]